MAADPCSICGGTDLSLRDGFYYCVECGTQDVNAREIVVESTMLRDGTFAHADTRKVKTAIKHGLEMSGEWHKWHTFNFILSGLMDELIALGAKPTVKLKVMWAWSQYIKQFQDKEEMGVSLGSKLLEEITSNASTTGHEADSDGSGNKPKKAGSKKPMDSKIKKALKDIEIVSKGLLVSILYAALNLDKSDIQLYHLCRYIREGRLSIMECSKFIPKELDTSKIPHWKNFIRCTREPTPNYIRSLTLSLFKALNLGTPLVPDLRKLIDNYAAELCLPNDFKDLVFSLMNLLPCDFLYIDLKIQRTLVRVPEFEVICMSYVLIALKMCFGLDSDYEVRLSDKIDQMNVEENYIKSCRLGNYSPTTDRLFSFREWSNYLQFRKLIVSKFYLPMAHQHEYEVDDRVFMEQSTERPKRKKKLGDEVTMDILNQINSIDDVGVIPITEFKPTLTPMSTYTQIIIEYIQDPTLKVLLSEDFTQYSIKYAFCGMNFPTEDRKLLTGVNEFNKTINKNIVGTLVSKKTDMSMVYVRNCENKNWWKTKPPTLEHVFKEDDDQNHDDGKCENSDNSNENDIKCSPEKILVKSDILNEIESLVSNSTITEPEDKQLEVIEEEKQEISIFDDNFDNMEIKEEPDEQSSKASRGFPFVFENELFEQEGTLSQGNIGNNDWDNQSTTTNVSLQFNPETFDREKAIRELVLRECKKHKIPVPPEYKTPREPRKRKSNVVHIGTESEPKKPRIARRKPGENKKEIDRILTDYYDILEKDILHKVSDQVTTVVQNLGLGECDDLEDGDHNAEKNNDRLVEITEHDKSNSELVDENNEINLSEQYLDNEIKIEDFLPKSDPKFDEKTHNIRQLYIKFQEKFNLHNLLYDDDPELDKIISKQLEQSRLDEVNSDIESKESDLSDSEDHNGDEEECNGLLEAKNGQCKDVLEPFVKDSASIKDFKYWFRHYLCESVKKNLEMKKFDLELTENFPPSFVIVIQECASILGYTAFTLYKSMQDIEQMLISRSKQSIPNQNC